jgi:fibronectin-binding autotransporter adhesin
MHRAPCRRWPLLGLALLCFHATLAADRYWDTADIGAPGDGLQGGPGTWTGASWSTNTLGSPRTAFSDGDSLFFETTAPLLSSVDNDAARSVGLLRVSGGNDVTLRNPSAPGGVNMTLAGPVQVQGAGALRIHQRNWNALGTPALALDGGSLFELNMPGTEPVARTFTLGAVTFGAGANRLALVNDLAATNLTLSVTTLNGGAGQEIDLGAGTANRTRLTVSGTASSTFSGLISGTGHLTKQGTGALTLNSANTFTGDARVTAGDLVVAHSNALGRVEGRTTVISGTGTSAGGQLHVRGGGVFAEPLELSGHGDGGFNGALFNVSGTNVWSGPITLLGASRVQSGAGVLVLSGGVTGPGGTAALTFSGNTIVVTGQPLNLGTAIQSVHGGVTVLGVGGHTTGLWQVGWSGIVRTDVANALNPTQIFELGAGTNQATTATATLGLNGFNQTVAGLRTQPAVLTNPPVGSTRTVTSVAPAILTLNPTAGVTYNGAIRGAISLVKGGSGSQTLTGGSDFTGTVTVNAGDLIISHADALGSSATNTVVNSGTGLATSPGGRLVVVGSITVNEPVTLFGEGHNGYNGALRVNDGNAVWAGPITLGGNARIHVENTNATADSLTITGGITCPGNQTLVLHPVSTNAVIRISGQPARLGADSVLYAHSAGRAELNVSSNVFGTAAAQYGCTLRIGVTNAVPVTANLVVGASATGNALSGTFDLNGCDQTVAGLLTGNLPGQVLSGGTRRITNSNARPSVLTVGNGNPSTLFDGGIQDGAGRVSLVKAGSGVQTLAGASTYTGATDVLQGTLKVNGSLGGTGAVSVASTAILNGAGSIAGAVTVHAGGRLEPGNGIGHITLTGNLDLQGTLAIETNATTNDLVRGVALVTLGASSALDLSGTLVRASHVIMRYTTRTGSIGDVSDATAQGYEVVYDDLAGEVRLQTLPATITVPATPAPGLSWPTRVGRFYTLQYRPELNGGNWTDVPGHINLAGTGSPITLPALLTSDPRGYYRMAER